MANIKEIIENTNIEWEKSLPENDKVLMNEIKKILSVLDTIVTGGLSNKIELSKIAGTLANYKFSLSECLSNANKKAKLAEDYYKSKKSIIREAVKDELEKEGTKKVTKDDINAKIDEQVIVQRIIFSLEQAYYENLKNYYYTISEMLDVIKQRIMVIMSEEGAVKYANDELGMKFKNVN